MDRLKALVTWVRGILFRRAADAEMDEELRFHLEMETEHNLRAGMAPAEARRRALVSFGGVERRREQLREGRRLPLLETLWYDARFAVRYLRRDVGPSLTAIVVLALGIGLTTGMYSVIDFMLHPALKVPDGDRIVQLTRPQRNGMFAPVELRAREYADWVRRQRSMDVVAGSSALIVNLRSGDHPVQYRGGLISAGFTDVWGGKLLLGRAFVEADEKPGSPVPVLLGYYAWADQFNGDRGVIGRRVIVNGEPGQIVGVMDGMFVGAGVALPLRLETLQLPSDTGQTVSLVGKLRRGVSVREASAEARTIAAALAADYPGGNRDTRVEMHRPNDPPTWFAIFLYSMLATVSMVLWIACANVTNLLLVRIAVRSKDVAVRMALGASRARTIAQLMSEAAVLVITGASLGVGIAWGMVRLWIRLEMAAGGPQGWLQGAELDDRVFLFMAVLVVFAILGSGLIPAWRAASANVGDVLKDGSGGSSSRRMGKLSRGLVIAEMAMSVSLLVMAGLMMRRAARIAQEDLPFDTQKIFTAEVVPFAERPVEASARDQFWADVEHNLGELQGVPAGLATFLPGVRSPLTQFAIEGASYIVEADMPSAQRSAVSSGFFATFGATALQGRTFEGLDNREGQQVVVVNQAFARLRWPGGPILGRRLRLGGPDSEEPWRTIVGIVPDLYMAGVTGVEPDDQPAVYTPLAQEGARRAFVVAMAGEFPLRIRGAVRNAVSQADADTPIETIMTLSDRIVRQNSRGPFGVLFLVFGGAALFMASVGLYGLMSFGVSQRRAEMGVRMAIGAAPAQVRGLVLREGMMQVVIGMVVGSALALLVAYLNPRLLMPRSIRESARSIWDPSVYGLVVGILAVAALIAIAIPAYRATRGDPAAALRAS